MSTTELKNEKLEYLNSLLMEKWGFKAKDESSNKLLKEDEDLGAYYNTVKGGDYRTGQLEYPLDEEEDTLKEEDEGDDNEIDEATEKGEKIATGRTKGEKAYEFPSKGEKSKTRKGEEDYTTKKGEKIKTGKTKGEKAYEFPSKGEKSKTDKGEEDYTTKKGMKKKTGPGKAYMQEKKIRETIRNAIKELIDEAKS